MSPDAARRLRLGDMVVLSTGSPAGYPPLNLWAEPGKVADDVADVESQITGQVWVDSLALVLGVAEVPDGQRVVDEPVEVLVLAGDCMGWVFASVLCGSEAH